MNIALSLNNALTTWSSKEAIIDGEKRFTYRQLARRISAVANSMLSMGLKKGDVVAAVSPNCHEYLEIYYACGITGIILNPMNYRLSENEMLTVLQDSGARVLFRHSDFKKNLKTDSFSTVKNFVCFGPDRVGGSTVELDYEEWVEQNINAAMPEVDLAGSDLAHLYYTSGTTGKAKGVMLTHENVTVNALGAVAEAKITDADVWAHIGPMFHLLDAWSIFAVTSVGATHVFIPYFRAEDVLTALEKNSVTITAMVPTMVNALLAEKNVNKHKFSSLRLLMTAGSPIAPEQVRKIVNSFDCDYVQFYGLTETSPFLTISTPKADQLQLPEDQLLQIKSRTGRPFIGASVKVVNASGAEVERNNTEVGEIVARGPVVFKGYYKQQDATDAAIRDGWFHTGDLAVIDGAGSINIVDRQKDMIITGGENVYSTEVEYAIYEHPAVKECAVLGIPDSEWGETVKAVIVLKEGQKAEPAEIIDHVKVKLAKYKAPRSVEFVAELPKTGSGKIYKKGLREQLTGKKQQVSNQ